MSESGDDDSELASKEGNGRGGHTRTPWKQLIPWFLHVVLVFTYFVFVSQQRDTWSSRKGTSRCANKTHGYCEPWQCMNS